MDKKEINRLIAEKVMGWEWVYDEENQFWCWKMDNGVRTNFNPTSWIEHAWEVVETIEKDIGGFQLVDVCDEKSYLFKIYFDGGSVFSQAETAPLAISLAALKSVGIELEEMK